MHSFLIVHNTDRYHWSHYEAGKPLPLLRLRPVALVKADSPSQALAIAGRGKGNEWQTSESVAVRLGKCERPTWCGDLVFDSSDDSFTLLGGHSLIPMHRNQETGCLELEGCHVQWESCDRWFIGHRLGWLAGTAAAQTRPSYRIILEDSRQTARTTIRPLAGQNSPRGAVTEA